MPNQIKKNYIIVAEDDHFYADIYKTKLTSEGYDVDVAENGEKALHLLKKRKPDLLVLDLIMPVKDGFQVLQEMRTDPNLQNIQVIACSNLGEKDDVNRIKDLKVNEYIVKANLSLNELMEIIKKHIK